MFSTIGVGPGMESMVVKMIRSIGLLVVIEHSLGEVALAEGSRKLSSLRYGKLKKIGVS